MTRKNLFGISKGKSYVNKFLEWFEMIYNQRNT